MPAATDEERALHARLVAGDATASAEVAERYLTGLIEVLRRKYPKEHARDETIVWDAATEALLGYVVSPTTFDPDRRTLQGYLFMSAKGDLLNARAKAQREHSREKSSDPVELSQLARNTEVRAPKAERELEHQELWTRIRELVPDPTEQEVVALMIEGERDTIAYAAVMSIGDQGEAEQRAAVKRMKDKLKARLKRAGWAGIIEDMS